MKTSSFKSAALVQPLIVLGLFMGCGGLNDYEVRPLEDAGGSAGDSSSGGSSSGKGGSSSGGSSSGGDAGDGGEPPIVISEDPPVVVSVTPEDAATGVEPTESIQIEFSESLDPETVNDETITVSDGTNPVSGQLAFSGVTATFTPDSRFDLLANLTVTVSTDVTDLEGTAMEEPFSSTFKVRDGTWRYRITLSNAVGRLRFEDPVPPPVLDAAGNTLAVWAQGETVEYDDPIAIWGRTFTPDVGWSSSFKISDEGADCSRPSVAMNAAGDAIVAWIQEDGDLRRVVARRYVAGTWEETSHPVEANSHTTVEYVATAVSPAGEMHVVWRNLSTYYSIYGNHSDGVNDWDTSDTYLYGSWDSVVGPRLAFGPDDNGFMVWSAHLGANPAFVRVARFITATSSGWQSSVEVPAGTGEPDGYYSTPIIVADEDGGAMAVWQTSNDVATSRFTETSGWSDAVPADTASDALMDWTPQLAYHNGEFLVMWLQTVGSVGNALSNRYVDGEWKSEPDLLSNGDTDVYYWSDLGFGLDRQGNGMATWIQDGSVRHARLIGGTQEWQADDELDTPDLSGIDSTMEVGTSVAQNGVAAAVYSTGYVYERRDVVYAAAFE